MKIQNHIRIVSLCSLILSFLFTQSVFAEATGNRYNLPRAYDSEVSSAEAFLRGVLKWEYKNEDGEKDRDKRTVIIDVRTVEEYAAGHPKKSYNIPYPHIQGRPWMDNYIGQNPLAFFEYVATTFPDRDTPILTLCRSGFRSVLAANILANPSQYVPEYEGMDIEGYNNVRNIWEGFVGNTKTFTDAETGEVFELDLNNDGEITAADQDGWANYQGLPYSTKLKKKRLYTPYLYLY